MPSPRSTTKGEYRPSTRGTSSAGSNRTRSIVWTTTLAPSRIATRRRSPVRRRADSVGLRLGPEHPRWVGGGSAAGLPFPLPELLVVLLRLGNRARVFGRLPLAVGRGRGVDLLFEA